MPRFARIIAPGMPHHVTQRGNYRQDVFTGDSDRRQYLYWIREYGQEYGVSMLAYCLMPNHVHLIAVPKDESSLSRTLNTAHMRYSQYRNKKLGQNGHLWQGRYFSCVMDDNHLLACARYIERNPVRAHIVTDPCDYIWSSARDHSGKSRASIIDTMGLFEYIEMRQEQWLEFISGSDNSEEISEIRKYTMTGRPLGSEGFIQKLEQQFGETLRAFPVGRPASSN